MPVRCQPLSPMCMRYTLTHTKDFVSTFGLSCGALVDRYNIAPTQDAPILIGEGDDVVCVSARWGLIPAWKKNAESGEWLANARSETLAEKPAFRDLVEHSRCIIPASGFYEWKKERGVSYPFYITLPSRPLFGFAGLCDWWSDPETGELKPTFTMVTCPSNTLVARIHNRMPVILSERDEADWLSGPYVPEVLQPYTEGGMAMVQVGQTVNNPRNEGAECIKEAGIGSWW